MKRFALLLSLTLVTACTGGPRERPMLMGPVDTGPGTLAQARKYLEGQWTLQSFEVFPPGQKPVTLTGSGSLRYDEYGNLQMEIRPDASSSALLTQAGIQVDGGVVSNKGRTAVDMQSRTLTFIMEGEPPLGAPSGPLALNRPRHWNVEGNTLTLTTNGDDGRPLSVGRWTKAASAPAGSPPAPAK